LENLCTPELMYLRMSHITLIFFGTFIIYILHFKHSSIGYHHYTER